MKMVKADETTLSQKSDTVVKSIKKENVSDEAWNVCLPETKPFKKGHRRAHSMPSNAHKAEKTLTNSKQQKPGVKQPEHRRRVKLHRHIRLKPNSLSSSIAGSSSSRNRYPHPDFDTIEVLDEEQNEFDVPINEEEMMRFPGMEDQSQQSDKISVHKRFWQLNWKRVHFTGLPSWLQDNEFLHFGHRPQLSSFASCFKSIFSLHTETGNILTHMYGAIAFIGIFVWFLIQSKEVVSWSDKLVFSAFFVGAILCMGMSFTFHTVQCHSENIGRLFSKLDYAGISLLIIGSFVPWLYYGFYCRVLPMIIYISMIITLGMAALVVSLFDKFSQPKFRPIRATVFMAMGLSILCVVPAIHLLVTDGILWMFEKASFHWLLLMGVLYLTGATIYMVRFPERCFPGKCDILFQSHQLFHIFVIFAAAVHYHGVLELAMKRLEDGSCSEQLISRSGTDEATVRWLDDRFRPY